MRQVFEQSFDLETTVHSDIEGIIEVLEAFDKLDKLQRDKNMTIDVKGQITVDLTDKINPKYIIKLNSI